LRYFLPTFVTIGILGFVLYSAGDVARADAIFTVKPIQLNAADPTVNKVGSLSYMGGIRIRSSNSEFGGLSGLDFTSESVEFISVSDKGYWFSGKLRHNEDGHLIGLTNAEYSPIPNLDRQSGTKIFTDAESVVRSSDGSYYVGFERHHRVLKFANPHDPSVTGTEFVNYSVFKNLPPSKSNKGIESLTTLPNDRLLLLTEDVSSGADQTTGWIVDENNPQELLTITYQTFGSFKPTDMTTLPNGDILVLERSYNPFSGAAARITKIKSESVVPGKMIVATELAIIKRPLTVDNFEGIAHRVDEQGKVEIYILSDDNYNSRQRTLLMQFKIEE
jgi:hypothetical protein